MRMPKMMMMMMAAATIMMMKIDGMMGHRQVRGERQAGGFNLRLRLITNANAIKAALAICLHFNLI